MNATKVIKFALLSALILFLIVTIPLTLLAHALQSTILKPYAQDEYLARSGVYQALTVTVQAQLQESVKNLSKNTVEQQVVNKLTKSFIESVVTEKWVREKMGGFQNGLWDYFLGKSNSIPPIDISDLHQVLVTNVQRSLSIDNKAILPQAVTDQIIRQMDKNIPTQLSVTETFHLRNSQFDKIKNGMSVERKVVSSLIWIVLFVTLSGLTISFYFQYSLRWLGYANIFVGLLLLTGSFYLRGIDLQKLKLFQSISGSTNVLKDSLYRLTAALQQEIGQIVFVENLILLIAGIALVGLSYFPFARRWDVYQRKLCSVSKYRWLRSISCVIIVGIAGWLVFDLVMSIMRVTS